MAIRNIKLREHQQVWLLSLPVGAAQHLYNRKRQLHRLAGYIADPSNRAELYSIIEELDEHIMPLLISIEAQLKGGQ